jgi:MFS transporter, CP family, cyanate transporter
MMDQKSSYRWLIVVLLFLIALSVMLTGFVLPPLFSEIAEEIPLTKSQMGIIFGVVPLAPVFFAVLAGGVSDKIGSRWALSASMLMIVAGGGLRAFAGSATELIGCMFLVGVGLSFVAPNVVKALGTWFPPNELGMANGLVGSGLGVGGALGLALSASVMSPAFGGWRGTMLMLAAFTLGVGILFVLLFREGTSQMPAESGKQNMSSNFKKAFKVKDVWLLGAFYGLFGVGMMAVSALLPVILEEKGVPRAGELASLIMWPAIVSTIIGGIASDKVGRRKPFLITSSIVLGVCIPALTVLTGAPLIIILILAGVAQGIILPVLMAIPAEHKQIGITLAATAVGVMFMLTNVGGFFGPVVAGKLIDMSGSPLLAFIVLGAALIVAAGVIVPVIETGTRPGDKSPK